MIRALFLIIALSTSYVSGATIDNNVVGNPEIECNADSILVNFNTQSPFEGHVYVKGRYNDVQCKSDATNAKTASLSVPFSACGVKRQRSANPQGLYMITTVVISFHPQFVTMVDKAYQVKCFYMEADKTVSANLEVSQITTDTITQNVPMPTCTYQVLSGGPNGQPVKYAKIGDQVYHKWSCGNDSSDLFCMTVNSCFVDDGSGTPNSKVQLLDEVGCAMDKYLITNINYTSNLVGGQNSMVFKFADKPTLFFNCQIKIQLVTDGKCVRSSANCAEPFRGKRSAIEEIEQKEASKGPHIDVYTPEITILTDIGEEASQQDVNQQLEELRRLTYAGQSFIVADAGSDKAVCLSSVGFSFLIAGFGVVVLSSIAILAIVCIKARRLSEVAAK